MNQLFKYIISESVKRKLKIKGEKTTEKKFEENLESTKVEFTHNFH